MPHHFLLRLEIPNAVNPHLPPPLEEIELIVRCATENEQRHSFLLTIGANGEEFDLAGNSRALVTFRPDNEGNTCLLVARIVHGPLPGFPDALLHEPLGELYHAVVQVAEENGQRFAIWPVEMPIVLTRDGQQFGAVCPVDPEHIPVIGVAQVPGCSLMGGIPFADFAGAAHFIYWSLGNNGIAEFALTQHLQALALGAYNGG